MNLSPPVELQEAAAANRVTATRKGPGRLLLFFSILIATIYAAHFAINTGLKRIPTSDFGAVNRFMNGRVDADIVISGSSRALVHYDPRPLGAQTGLKAFNIGRNGSHTDLQAAALKTYLQHNRKPELVIHNLDLHSLLPTEELYDVTTFVPYLSDETLYAGLRSIDKNIWKWRYIPLYAYVVEDVRFTWMYAAAAMVGVYPKDDYIDGYNPRHRQWSHDFENFKARNPNGVTVKTDPSGEAALQEIIRICQANKIRLVFVYSPEYIEAQNLTRNRTDIMAKLKHIADAASVPFLDFSDWPLCTDRELFYNSQHLNSRGADLFSRALASRLDANRVLPAAAGHPQDRASAAGDRSIHSSKM